MNVCTKKKKKVVTHTELSLHIIYRKDLLHKRTTAWLAVGRSQVVKPVSLRFYLLESTHTTANSRMMS